MTQTPLFPLRPANVALVTVCISLGVSGLGSRASAQAGEGGQVRVLRSDDRGVVLELNTPDFGLHERVVDGVTFSEIEVPGYGRTGEAGRPLLPLRGALVGVPPDAEVALKILADEFEHVPIAHPPLPVPSKRVRYDPAQSLPMPAGLSYATDLRLYPAGAVAEGSSDLAVPIGWEGSSLTPARLPSDSHAGPGERPVAIPGAREWIIGVVHGLFPDLLADLSQGLGRNRPAPNGPAEGLDATVPSATAIGHGQSMSQSYPAEAARIASTGQWRSQRYALVEFHPFQYDPASRQLGFHRMIRVELTFNYPGGSRPVSPAPPVDEGAFESVLQYALVNYRSSRGWRVRDAAVAAMLAAPRAFPAGPGPWYKLDASSDGFYRVTCAQLASAGIDLGSLDPRTLRLFDQGEEIAVHVAGQEDGRCDSGDGLEFYGRALDTRYTDTNVYWLTHGGDPGKRMAERDGGGTASISTSYPASVRVEQDRIYRSYAPLLEDADHWYWNYLPDAQDADGDGEGKTADYAVWADGLAPGDFTATLQYAVFGFNAGGHHTLVYVNDHLVDDAAWTGKIERRATVSFPQSHLVEGTNTVRVSVPGDSSSNDAIFVNSLDLSYQRTFTATGDSIRFRPDGGGGRQFEIAGFATQNALAYDISDPFNVAHLVNTTAIQSDSTYSLRFADSTQDHGEYLALTPSQFKTPDSISLDSASDLRAPSNAADYIVISPAEFIPHVQPLADHRSRQGLRVAVVDVQDVYDEFNDGEMDARAMRDFLAHAYAGWQRPAPSFVLLVGDGTFDFKNLLGTGEPTRIPPYLRMVDPWLGEAASDNQLVAFNPTDALPSLAIGRLPANSVSDVEAMVAKILDYEQRPPPGDWRSKVAFVSDNAFQSNGTADAAGDFWNLSDAVASSPVHMPAPFSPDRIYFNPCDGSAHPQCSLGYTRYDTPASARSAIVSAIDDGRLIVNYVGHSAIQFWASESLFGIADVDALATSGRLPVVLSMTCFDGYFHYPGLPSLAESLVRSLGRGALASWSPSGLGVATGHDLLDRGFFDAVMQRGISQLGLAATLGKAELWVNGGGTDRDLIDTFHLFGDPASRLALPAEVAPATPTSTATATPTPTTTPTATSTPSPTTTPTVPATASPTAIHAPACHSLTVDIDPPGKGSVTTPSPDCASGAGHSSGRLLKLSPSPAIGHYFAGWTGGTSSDADPLTLTLSGDLALTAHFAAYADPFTDTAGSFARSAISEVYARGIMAPVSPTAFDTQGIITRESMATFLANAYRAAAGSPAPVVPVPFTDIDRLPPLARDDVARIYGLGITTGTSADAYSPALTITRNQMGVFLARLYKAINFGVDAPVVATPFTDISAEPWAVAGISRIYGLGITLGTTPTTYTPYALVTREQMALFVVRLLRSTGH